MVGLVLCWLISSFWLHVKASTWKTKLALMVFYDCDVRMMIGYGICIIVLAYSGLTDLIIGRWRRGFLNLCLAAITAWVFFTTSLAM